MSELTLLFITLNKLEINPYYECEACGVDHNYQDDFYNYIDTWYQV